LAGLPAGPAPVDSRVATPAATPPETGGATPSPRRIESGAGRTGRQAVRPRRVPPILFEGDETPTPTASGPGARFVLGPARSGEARVAEAGPSRLPAACGARRLWLTAREPHWLFATWDLSAEELEALEALAAPGQLTLRVHEGAIGASPLCEIALAKSARSWFVHVGLAGAPYCAELGYVAAETGWRAVLTSGVAITPPEAPAAPSAEAAEFATIPVDVPFAVILKKVAEAARTEPAVAEVLETLRHEGFEALPSPAVVQASSWTPVQERALAEVLRVDAARRVWVSSIDVTHLVATGVGVTSRSEREEGRREHPSSPLSGYAASERSGLSSPGADRASGERPRGFWFNVNAELVIYGATEPDAEVTIAGRRVTLRADGSFSLRFALPDGDYELPVTACAKTRDDGRSAELRFQRQTRYQGQVGVHPQDAQLRPPRAEDLSTEEARGPA